MCEGASNPDRRCSAQDQQQSKHGAVSGELVWNLADERATDALGIGLGDGHVQRQHNQAVQSVEQSVSERGDKSKDHADGHDTGGALSKMTEPEPRAPDTKLGLVGQTVHFVADDRVVGERLDPANL